MSDADAWRQEAEARTEQLVGNLLRAGVLLSAAVVAVGAVVYLARHGTAPWSFSIFEEEPDDLRSPVGIVTAALQFRGRGLIQLGLLLLIATPVARVAFCAAAFARLRDFPYVVITLIVLALLLVGLFSSHGEGQASSAPASRTAPRQ